MLDDGKDLGIPDGILINAKGPYRYDTTLVPEGLQYEIVGVEPGNLSSITKKNDLRICTCIYVPNSHIFWIISCSWFKLVIYTNNSMCLL